MHQAASRCKQPQLSYSRWPATADRTLALRLDYTTGARDDSATSSKSGTAISSVIRKTLQLESRVHMQSGTIQSSLFAAMDAAGLPDSVAEASLGIFGDDIDFHTDLRRGDRFSVIYEVYYHQGRASTHRQAYSPRSSSIAGLATPLSSSAAPKWNRGLLQPERQEPQRGLSALSALTSPVSARDFRCGSTRFRQLAGTQRCRLRSAPWHRSEGGTSDGIVEFVRQAVRLWELHRIASWRKIHDSLRTPQRLCQGA
jgi:hypothetical protein